MEKAIALLQYLVQALVDHPEVVSVTSGVQENGLVLKVTVDPRDAGMVIGKKGYVIRAIRQLVNVIGSRERERVMVDIIPIEAAQTA